MAVTVGGTSITFSDNSVQTSAAPSIPVVTAGANYIGVAMGDSSATTGSYVQKIGARVFCSGTVRVNWSNRGNTTQYTTTSRTARIYVNGVAIGPVSTVVALTYYTHDVTVAPGDIVSIYAVNGSSSEGSVSLYGIGVSQTPPICWAAPINLNTRS
jgi:hypothetical protein